MGSKTISQSVFFLLTSASWIFFRVGSSTHVCLNDHIFHPDGICCSPTQLLFRVGSSLVLALSKSEFYLIFSQIIFFSYFISAAGHWAKSVLVLKNFYKKDFFHRRTQLCEAMWRERRILNGIRACHVAQENLKQFFECESNYYTISPGPQFYFLKKLSFPPLFEKKTFLSPNTTVLNFQSHVTHRQHHYPPQWRRWTSTCSWPSWQSFSPWRRSLKVGCSQKIPCCSSIFFSKLEKKES